MIHTSRSSSRSTKLSAPVLRQLNSYALAASAAGVSLLALTHPCAAEIVYTPANTSIGVNQTLGLDLNHDGIVDFNLENKFVSRSFAYRGWLSVLPAQAGNEIWGHSATDQRWASALPAGFLVGSQGQFYAQRAELMTEVSSDAGRPPGSFSVCLGGAWGGVNDRYLAFKFRISGEVHYGWARLSVSCKNLEVHATLTGYAYETVADRPTVTGLKHYPTDSGNDASQTSAFPASLGQLARGVANQPSRTSDAALPGAGR